MLHPVCGGQVWNWNTIQYYEQPEADAYGQSGRVTGIYVTENLRNAS